jgi:hypothetical protein
MIKEPKRGILDTRYKKQAVLAKAKFNTAKNILSSPFNAIHRYPPGSPLKNYTGKPITTGGKRKTKRRHTKRRKSRKARKSRK